MQAVSQVLIGGFVTAIIVTLGIFVMKAVGVYKLMRNRGMSNQWMAFIPIVCDIAQGRIADDIERRFNKRSHYTGLGVAAAVVSAVGAGTIAFGLSDIFWEILRFDYYQADSAFESLIVAIMLRTALSSLIGLASIVIKSIILYKLVSDYMPNTAVLCVVLNVFFRIVDPIVMLVISSKRSISIDYLYQQQYQQQQYQQYQQQQPPPPPPSYQ